MVFDVCETIHHLSRVMTLEPYDIIATGTPAGVGFAMKPQQVSEIRRHCKDRD
jgi:2-keto-4-pentenoate hydratase/2-oxohepta-3-ene-1,7-dioic acid hydratase in catechol pathway